MEYTAVIGLEVHVQLLSRAKMFSQEATVYGQPPNTQTSPVTLAHPGTLPTINQYPIELIMKIGLACHSRITRDNYFARKNYFYPDLPKGFQITQHKNPLCEGGYLLIKDAQGKEKKVALERIHLEEDTGKSIHTTQGNLTLVNYDRAGTPLAEIVTQPVVETPEEAAQFLIAIRRLLRYLDVSDGHMEEGSLRCDANVSIMPKGSKQLGNKVELKNMNSIRHVKLALLHEIKRQTAIKEAGGKILSETRSYDPQTGETIYQRTKEILNDYRYFAEPDLSPFTISDEWLSQVKQTMPILPRELVKKFVEVYKLSLEDSITLTEEKEVGLFFDALCQYTPHYKMAANWVIGPIKSYLNTEKETIHSFPIQPNTLAALIELVATHQVSFSVASKELFEHLLEHPNKEPKRIAQEYDWLQVDNQAQLTDWIEKVMTTYPEKVDAYRNGKHGLLGFFVGEVMKISQRKANPKKVSQAIKEKLK